MHTGHGLVLAFGLSVLALLSDLGSAGGGAPKRPEKKYEGKTVAQWTGALKDPQWFERHLAAMALAEIGPEAKAAVPALGAALKDAEMWVRNSAAFALGKIGPDARGAVPALLRSLSDAEDRVGRSAKEALELIGSAEKQAVGEVLVALKHPDSAVRRFAAQALVEIGPRVPGVAAALEAALNDKDASVRQATALALAKAAGDPDARRLLTNAPPNLADPARRQVANALVAGAAARNDLPELLRFFRQPAMRFAVVPELEKALAATGNVGFLLQAYLECGEGPIPTDSRGRLQRAAATRLARIVAATREPETLAAVLASRDTILCRMALGALARVPPLGKPLVVRQVVGDTCYFCVSLPAPKDLGPVALPEPGHSTGLPPDYWAAYQYMYMLYYLPRLVPQDGRTAAVCYVGSLAPRRGATASLEFAGKVTGDGGARLLLRYPTRPRGAGAAAPPAWAESEITLDLDPARAVQLPRRPAPAEGVSALGTLQGVWASAQVYHWAVLEAGAAPAFGFYGVARELTGRQYHVPALPLVSHLDHLLPGPHPSPHFEALTGEANFTDVLGLCQLASPDALDRGARQLDVREAKARDLASPPWTTWLAGKRPAVEPLAALVPEDNYYLTFKDAASFLEFGALLQEGGGNLLPALGLGGRDYQLRKRYERQLCLDSAALARALPPDLLRGLALTGSDPFLVEGTDLSVVFHVADATRFLAAAEPFLRAARQEFGDRLHEAKATYEGQTIESYLTPRREVSLHRSAVGAFVIYSNSPAAIRRILDAHARRIPVLGGAADFQYARTVLGVSGADEDGFAFLSQAFIQRLGSAAFTIKERRRREALARLRLTTYAALFARGDSGRVPADSAALRAATGLTPEDFDVPEGKPIVWDGARQQAASEAYNTVHFATPLLELPLGKITRREQAGRDEPWGFWPGRGPDYYCDHAALRYSLRPGQVRVAFYLLPLAQRRTYDGLREWLGGSALAFEPVAIGPTTAFQFLVPRPGWPPLEYTKPELSKMLGSGLVLRGADSPVYRQFADWWARQSREQQFPVLDGESSNLISKAPLVVGVQVRDAKMVDKFFQAAGEGKAALQPKPPAYKGVTLRRQADGQFFFFLFTGTSLSISPTSYHHVQLEDGWYWSPQAALLHGLIDDRAAARRDKGAGPDKSAGPVNASFYVAPGLPGMADAVRAYLTRTNHHGAVANGLVWHALYRSGAIPADGSKEMKRAAALHWFGHVPVSADGTPYTYDRRTGEAINPRHGSPWRPQRVLALDENLPLAKLLTGLRSLRVDVRFREDGMHTVLTIERQAAAK